MIPFNKPKVLLLSSSLLLASCSTLFPQNSQRVEQLVTENAYEQAIATYQKLTPEEQAKVDLKKIEADKKRYESKLLQQIQSNTRKNAFIKAQELLDQAYETMPSHKSLQKVADQLADRRSRYIAQYELKRNRELGEFLVQEKPLLDKLRKAQANDRSFRSLYNDREEDRHTLSETLGVEGLAAYEKKDFKNAKPLLQLAEQLHSDPRWKSALKTIQKQEKGKKYQTELAKKKKQQAKIEKLQNAFNQAMKDTKFNQAKNQLATLKSAGVDEEWLLSAEEQLQEQIDNSLASALKRGRMLYSQGRIEQALKIWKQVQAYVPDNRELNDNIERAERFQQRYQQLKK